MSNNLAAALAQVRPFSQASQFQLRKLAAAAAARRFKARDAVANQEAWSHSLWFSTAGVLRVTQYHPLGAQATSQVAGPHSLVGCLDPSCSRRHAMECFAVTDAEVVFLPRAAVDQSLRADANLALAAVSQQSDQLWEEREFRLACQLPSGPRLAALLLLLYRKLGHRIPLTRRALADTCGLTRETVIRTVSPLEKSGAIRSFRGAFEILKPDALESSLHERRRPI